MLELRTARLTLTPFSLVDLEEFVSGMLTDPRVVEHYHSYDPGEQIPVIREQARRDFWDHFEESRTRAGTEVWAAYSPDSVGLVGWSGLLTTEVSSTHGGPELQYMIAGNAQGHGFATELARAVLDDAKHRLGIETVIGVVDVPNEASIRVLEKLGFLRVGRIEAYGSDEMLLFAAEL